jgi:hypothetical protein
MINQILHHIIPLILDGLNEIWNIIPLTLAEKNRADQMFQPLFYSLQENNYQINTGPDIYIDLKSFHDEDTFYRYLALIIQIKPESLYVQEQMREVFQNFSKINTLLFALN